jgi:hypothetical protein
MNDLRAAAQQALEALMWHDETVRTRGDNEAITALRAALAQQEQEPSVCARCGGLVYDPVWVAQSDPPRREWQSLTEEEIRKLTFHNQRTLWPRPDRSDVRATAIPFARAIEQALKERNT